MSEGATINVLVLEGVEGLALYMNNYRVAGPKPWGGGAIIREWQVEVDEIDRVLGWSIQEALEDIAWKIVGSFAPVWELSPPPWGEELFTPAEVRAKANEIIDALRDRARKVLAGLEGTSAQPSTAHRD